MGMIAALDRIGQIQSTIESVAGGNVFTAPQNTATTTTSLPQAQALAASSAEQFSNVLNEARATPATGTVQPATQTPTPTPATGASSVNSSTDALLGDGEVTGKDVAARAHHYLGTPYVWGGESLDEGGLDCSGLVQLVFKDLGMDVPRTVATQRHAGEEVGSLADARPGDLLITNNGKHVLIHIGNNQVIHSPRPGKEVEIRDIYETDADIVSIRRIVPAEAAPADSVTGSQALDGLLALQGSGR